MSPELISIYALCAMFVVATMLPVNMGVLAFVGRIPRRHPCGRHVGQEIIAGFPGGLFLTLVGITYLFALAQNNGTIDWLVRCGARGARPDRGHPLDHVRHRRGADRGRRGQPRRRGDHRPDRAGIRRAVWHQPAADGLLVIHGAQAGGFSPISIYGGITNDRRQGRPAARTSSPCSWPASASISRSPSCCSSLSAAVSCLQVACAPPVPAPVVRMSR